MRIVIADDELWARTALRSMLQDIDPELKIEGEAANGRQMVEIVGKKQPDLVFVDIRMPQMDGLDGIEEASSICPDTSWVILSGFSDFPYAQRAIALGVEGYLLKPVNPEKLSETIQKIQERKNREQKSRDTDFQHYLISNFYTTEDRIQRNMQFDSLLVIGMVIYSDTNLGNHHDELYYEQIRRLLIKRIDGLGGYGNVSSAFFMDEPGKWILSVGIYRGKEQENERKRKIHLWFLSLQNEIQAVCDKDFNATGICTGWCQYVKEMVVALNKCDSCEYLRILLGTGRIWDIDELREQGRHLKENLHDFCRKLESVGKGIRSRSYLNFLEAVTQAEGEWIRCRRLCSYEEIARMKHYLAVVTGINRILGWDEFRKMAMEDLLPFIRENARALLSVKENPEPERDVVNLAEEYVENYYAEDISIAQIAGQLELTPNYLSALFHKRKGITFVKYLTKVRMIRAEEFLLNTDLPVSQISGKVGYTDTRYFAKVFKEYFGILPSVYRKKNCKNKKEEQI